MERITARSERRWPPRRYPLLVVKQFIIHELEVERDEFLLDVVGGTCLVVLTSILAFNVVDLVMVGTHCVLI